MADTPSPRRFGRDVALVLVAHAASSVGDAASFTVLPLLILELTGSAGAMGLLAALQMAPDVLFGLHAGALADRADRRALLVGADVGRALLTAAIPLAALAGAPVILVVAVALFPIHLLRVLFTAAVATLPTRLVEPEAIPRLHSISLAITAGGFVVGSAGAGALASRVGAANVLAIDAASFAISAALLLLVRADLGGRQRDAGGTGAALREALAFLRGTPAIVRLLVYVAAAEICIGGLVPMITVLFVKEQARTPGFFGTALSVFAIGSIVGAVLASRASVARLRLVVALGNVGLGAAMALLPLASAPGVVLALALVTGGANAMSLVAAMSLRDAATPNALSGRVGAVGRLVIVAFQGLGALAAGALVEASSAARALGAFGAALAALSLAYGAWPPPRSPAP